MPKLPFPRLFACLAAAAAGISTYWLALRPWHQRWGASEGELNRPLPGDELVPAPKSLATHAVTVDAPAAAVWPWLVQMGCQRAGWYSYDRLDNGGVPSADRVLPEFQSLAVGDVILATPDGSAGFPVLALEPGRYLILGGYVDPFSGRTTADGPQSDAYFKVSWLFYLDEVARDTTRLITRFRVDHAPAWLGVATYGLLEPLSFVMERKMLLNLKRRVEEHARRTVDV